MRSAAHLGAPILKLILSLCTNTYIVLSLLFCYRIDNIMKTFIGIRKIRIIQTAEVSGRYRVSNVRARRESNFRNRGSK
jgi:hypothetical protein